MTDGAPRHLDDSQGQTAHACRTDDPAADPFLSYLTEQPPAGGKKRTSVTTLDDDLYG